jgi:Tfp pilus assembly pilus retraction ATPase PilT
LLTSVTKEKIIHGKDDELPSTISQCRADGMHSFTDSLCELVQEEKVHYDTAMDSAPNREALESAIKGIKTGWTD